MEESSNGDTQYTNDTLVQVSKNFLKKTLIKNEAIKRANKELLDLYNVATEKKPEEIITYIQKDPTLSEKYKIFKEINDREELKKIIREKKRKEHEEKIKNLAKKKEIEESQMLRDCEAYKKCEKDYDLFKKIYLNPMQKKRKILSHYADIMDKNNGKNDDLKIQVFDLICGKQ